MYIYIVLKKIILVMKNKIIIKDAKGNNLKNLSSNISEISSTTIVAKSGLIDKKKFYLFKGQIISSKKNNEENEIIKFEQLNIDLSDLSTTTIKKPKIQETSTIELLKEYINISDSDEKFRFLKKTDKLTEVFKIFENAIKKRIRIGAVFITENGKILLVMTDIQQRLFYKNIEEN